MSPVGIDCPDGADAVCTGGATRVGDVDVCVVVPVGVAVDLGFEVAARWVTTRDEW
jgi:hypothetical protein